MTTATGNGTPAIQPDREIALVELVNRVLDRGVVLTGEIVVSVTDVDLLYLNLSLVLSSVETLTGDGHRARSAAAPAPRGGPAAAGGAAAAGGPSFEANS